MNAAMRHTQPSAGYLIGLRSGYWRPAARLLVQVLGRVSQCRVRDNDVLMSLSVSSTQAPLHPGRGLAGRPRITHRGCCCSDGDGGHWVTCDCHEAAVTEVTQQLVCHTQQPAHN